MSNDIVTCLTRNYATLIVRITWLILDIARIFEELILKFVLLNVVSVLVQLSEIHSRRSPRIIKCLNKM